MVATVHCHTLARQGDAFGGPLRHRGRRVRADAAQRPDEVSELIPDPRFAVHQFGREEAFPDPRSCRRLRFHDFPGAGAVPVRPQLGVQHLLDTLHLVHQPSEGSSSQSQTSRCPGPENNHGGIQRLPVEMRPSVELRLGVHSLGLHASGHLGHVQLLRDRSGGSPVHRGCQETLSDAGRHLSPPLHDPAVFLLHGSAEGRGAVNQSFWRRRRGLRIELADRSAHQGVVSWRGHVNESMSTSCQGHILRFREPHSTVHHGGRGLQEKDLPRKRGQHDSTGREANDVPARYRGGGGRGHQSHSNAQDLHREFGDAGERQPGGQQAISGSPPATPKMARNCPETVIQFDVREAAPEAEHHERRTIVDAMKIFSKSKGSTPRLEYSRKPFIALAKLQNTSLQPWPSATNLTHFEKEESSKTTPSSSGAGKSDRESGLRRRSSLKKQSFSGPEEAASKPPPSAAASQGVVNSGFSQDYLTLPERVSCQCKIADSNDNIHSDLCQYQCLHKTICQHVGSRGPVRGSTRSKPSSPRYLMKRQSSLESGSKKKGVRWKSGLVGRDGKLRRRTVDSVPTAEKMIVQTKSSPELSTFDNDEFVEDADSLDPSKRVDSETTISSSEVQECSRV
ncbi:uncharacterized protein LOC105695312 isoform X3 [Orussus abietinus]|uniref:uncharacterized protein LOC105695312 isoform X3 n=1 Tax=Orussus abietinus TaxID=222816 RepID=UPI00062618E0|nr:uncharacterized protein LOC105695312 isoform X3 [Orussus abietinus]